MFTTHRPDSPPPRSPSPDVVLAPLPPAPRRLSTTRLSLQPSGSRKLTSTRSCGDLRRPPTTPKSRSVVSEPASPASPDFRRTHKRTPAFAVRCRSPPPSPIVSSPVPPVPPIPDFVLAPTDKKPVLHPAPTRVNQSPIYLPEWEHFTVARKPRTSGGVAILSARRAVAAPAPMTCSTFFALHNASSQTPPSVVAL